MAERAKEGRASKEPDREPLGVEHREVLDPVIQHAAEGLVEWNISIERQNRCRHDTQG